MMRGTSSTVRNQETPSVGEMPQGATEIPHGVTTPAAGKSEAEQPARMRLSLRELFAIVTVCAVFAWCVSYVGADNAIFWSVVAINLGLVSVFVRALGSKSFRWAAVAVPATFMFCGVMPFHSIAVALNGLLLVIAGGICLRRGTLSAKARWRIGAVTTATAFMAATLLGAFRTRQIHDLRADYPIESLSQRLAYEADANKTVGGGRLPALSQGVLSELANFENELGIHMDGWLSRREQLVQLHGREAELFAKAGGFGVGRMMIPSGRALPRPPLVDIPFAGPDSKHWQSAARYWRRRVFHDDPITEPDQVLARLHVQSRDDFLHPDGFGAMMPGDDLQVAGFIEHAFHMPPLHAVNQTELWQLERLELVSLLKFDEPRAYVLDHLPRMDELSANDVPTRPLDDFESDALQQLGLAEDVVIDEVSPDRFRMVGSLRAAEKCTDCHSVSRGELLGVFSYDLRRVTQVP